MARIYDTIKYWSDGQNALNATEVYHGVGLQRVVQHVMCRLQRYHCLADLASAYYADGDWWPRFAQEFSLPSQDAQVVRNAAYWQRFMQIRHPRRSAS